MLIANTKDIVSEQINHFFTSPYELAQPPYSTLYSIRKDIELCIGSHTIKKEEDHILFPGLLTIVAGIDLLAKLHSGNDYPNKVRSRFKSFTEKYFNLSETGYHVLYQLRNSLIFSLNLSSRVGQGSLLKFVIDNNLKKLYEKKEGIYIINLSILNVHFEQAVERYHQDLKVDLMLQKRFKPIYILYGCLPLYSIS